MTPDELRELLVLGHEAPGVEFKAPCDRTDKPKFAKIVRAVLGMANRRDGGKVVVGIEEGEAAQLSLLGLSSEQLRTWEPDAVAGAIDPYADPFVTVSTARVSYEGLEYVVLKVSEFEEVPVLCKKDYPDVLRQGACYVRRRGRIETSEIPTQAAMRDLIELATEKGIRKFLHQMRRAGVDLSTIRTAADDVERFEQQRGDFR